MDKVLRSFLSTLIVSGSLDVVTATGQRFTVGDGTAAPAEVHFKDLWAELAFIRNPGLRFGELYMDGRVAVTRGTIYDVLALAARNIERFKEFPWLRAVERLRYVLRGLIHNRQDQARRNTAHHYDLDGRLYQLFLDQDRQYSCAYFERDGGTLDDAQLAKKRHIAAKLLIEAGDKVLDIGCGWGGMALYLAQICDAHVTGITLSQEQHSVALQRAIDAGQESKTEFLLQDYREIDERFDRIVSVGMFEHVGLGSYDAYFQQIARLLDDDGVALLHTIGHSSAPSPTNPWVAKYIFPGGYIPSLSDIMPAVERAGLIVSDIEILRLHYAETLKHWRERFAAHRKEAAALYDERFCRMWEFYLAGCECTFRYEGTVVFQIQLAKRIDTVPITRDYIAAREADLRRRDSATESATPGLRIAG
ncbi:MAG: class I SAM-dependent methyltransferase [Methylovirgula sp.]